MQATTIGSSAYKKTRALYESTYPDAKLGVYTEEDWARLRRAESFAFGTSVLDIGPGNGALLQILARSKRHRLIHGVDVHRHSQLLLPEGVNYHLQSVTDLEFDDASFDTVFCMEVLEHLEDADLEPGLAQLRRVANKRLVMTVPYHEPHPLWWHDKPGGHRQQFDAQRLIEMFPTAHACFQKRHGVDWIFLVEGNQVGLELPTVQEILAPELGESAPPKAVPPLERKAAKEVAAKPAPAAAPTQDQSTVDKNHDRIADVYYRRHGSGEMQEQARDRIHWILSQVQGEKVLDIGCSQGLVPILLGRSGYNVLGIDLIEEAIAQAKTALKADPQSVQDLVTFRVADGSDLDDLSGFDTVISGEIIEHHAAPARLVKSMHGALNEGGRLVLTTPFAFHPDPDHKQTFFLSHLADLLSESFDDVELFVMHDFICCTATARAMGTSAKTTLSDRELLERSETAFLSLQMGLRKQLKDVRFMYAQAKKETFEDGKRVLHAHLETLRADRGASFRSAFFEDSAGAGHLTKVISNFLAEPSQDHRDQLATLLPFLYGRLAKRVTMLLDQRSQLQEDKSALEAEVEELRSTLRSHKATIQFRSEEKRSIFSEMLTVLSGSKADTKGSAVPGSPAKARTTSQAKEATAAPANETAKWIRHIEHQALSLPVACILDEFSWENFRYECDLYQITKENWKQELEKRRPEFLFVESAWAGNDSNWKYKITYKEARDENPLFALLEYCKTEGIPTVFWNKEDPPNYDQFIDAAARFDYIFTTDVGCVPNYEKQAPNSKIAVLPFAAQPCLQNPVNTSRMPKLGDICFAGAWYPRHPERFEDLKHLLFASTDYDLHIFDRYLNHPQHENYLFPEAYQPFIKGSLGFREMTEKYRNYQIFLNVNSVKDSPSMFSRRVFEILACGTPVVSGYAQGIEEMLGEDVVPLVRNAEEAKECIDRLMGSQIERDKLVLRGQRKIFSEHTYRHRFQSICEALGIEARRRELRVSVITATIRSSFTDNFLENFARQSYANKELIVVINENRELTKEHIDSRAKALGIVDYKVIVAPEATTLGSCLNMGVAESNGDIFAKMDDDDYYGEAYLQDSVLALEYSGADCVGKESYFTYVEGQDQTYLQAPGREHRETKFAIGTTLVGYSSLFPQVSFGNTRVGEDTAFLKRLAAAGKKMYSHSPYNYIKLYARNLEHHTWKIDEASYLKRAVPVCEGFASDHVCF